MRRFQGKGVCGGVAIGKTAVLHRASPTVTKTHICDIDGELRRLQGAMHRAKEQLSVLCGETKQMLGEDEAQIFEIHAMMLEDEDFTDAVFEMIGTTHCNAEYAVQTVAAQFAERFSSMEDAYMQARSADVRDIGNRLLQCLTAHADSTVGLTAPCILCADDLTPSETAGLKPHTVLGFATAGGSANSHTAILARSMNIPAIVGLGKEFFHALRDGETILLDGDTGECILSPDAATLLAAQEKQNRIARRMAALHALREEKTVTQDGAEIALYANIGHPNDVHGALQNGAEGIGLFRSEFIYLSQHSFPDEITQFCAYREVLEQMQQRRVIIRTLDIGADKQAAYFRLPHEENPALGVRGIRLCLNQTEVFLTQLRALYRASVYGRLAIMFPMITTADELKQTLALCRQVEAELTAEGIPFSRTMEFGIMIETPAAALISDQLAGSVDFFSIGTNDLTQYTLACDRQNPKLDHLNEPPHEAVLRLIDMTVRNAHDRGIWVGICGELAADPALTERFLRGGVDELSVSPKDILPLREKIRSFSLELPAPHSKKD